MEIFNQIFEFAKANPIVLIVAYFLFKDKIDPFFNKLLPKPAPPSDTVTVQVPVTPPAEPADKPVIEAILKLLPVILPVILAQIEKSKVKE